MLRTALASVFTILLASNARAEPGSLQDVRKHLVFDSRVVDRVVDAQLVLGKPEKHPNNPLLVADRPWENSLNNLYANVAFDPGAKHYKMWYGCVLADKDAIAKMDPPRTVHDVGWYELLATSDNGISWKRYEVGQHAFAGSKANNAVVRDTPNVGVFRDTNPKCPPDRQFKMIYDVGLGKMRVRFSPDGVQWSEPIEPKGFGLRTGDTHNNAWWDERLGKYVAITRFVLGERLVARAESDDFINWTNERLALRSTIDEGKARQTYCMPAFAYGNAYLGFLMMYNVAGDKTVDCELAWSPDTITWHRIKPGSSLIPRGEGKAYDSKCIYAAANPPIVNDGKLHVYYGGSGFPHIGWKRHCLPCLATFRMDGFAGLRPEAGKAATITTHPMRWTDDELRISADIESGGSLQIIAEAEGKEFARTKPITENASNARVEWERGADELKRVKAFMRLRFEMKSATLYAFRGPEMLPTDAKPIAAKRVPWEERFPGKGKPVVMKAATFDRDAERWSAIDAVSHADGFVRVHRKGGQPYLMADAKASQGNFVGDWQKTFGGTGVRISFKVRAEKPGATSRVEIFAKDIAQWSFDRLPKASSDWQTVSTTLRFDWTDSEAEAAGWRKAIHAFSWHDTVTHVGRLVLAANLASDGDAFDIDDVRIETIYE
ncbi:MAG: hypothetical protein U0744_15760 [Gemmataceae bacterium]